MSEGGAGSDDLGPGQVAFMLATLVVGALLIAASFVVADMRQDAYEEDMGPYDAAVDLVEQVNGNGYLRGVDPEGNDYDYVILSKSALEWFSAHPGHFEENITSDHHYRITIDDLDIPDDVHNPVLNLSSHYVFGERPPRDANVVRITVQYTLHLRTDRYPSVYWHDFRHAGQMTVEVWE